MAIVKFYRGDPDAPKTTMPAHLGANVLIVCENKLLLEKRSDCEMWGLVGGGVKKQESPEQAITREIYEELGLRVSERQMKKLAVYGEPGRIAAYRDGSIWRMVVVAYLLELQREPQMRISRESRELRFFSADELKKVPIVVTHSDIIDDWFIQK